MKKATSRVLVILAIFIGVMLLLEQFLVGTAVAAQQTPASTTYNDAANRSTITTTQPTVPPVAIDAALAGECVQVPTSTYKVYLPLTFSSNSAVSDARIRLKQEPPPARIKGLTVFTRTPTVTLDLSEIQFSPAATCIRWWYPSNPSISSTYQFLTDTIAVSLLPEATIKPGAQQIMVEFVSKTTIPLSVQTFTFFYIPNGDFQETKDPVPSEGSDSWIADSTVDNKVNISGGSLILRTNDSGTCEEAGIGFEKAYIDLELPTSGEFYLNVSGTVFTQDQNPSNSSTFDAFEVVIDGTVADRVSNTDQPIRCNPVINRQVVVDSRIPLSGYSGNTTISLENHRRFDNQYDTYTKIDMVWIDY